MKKTCFYSIMLCLIFSCNEKNKDGAVSAETTPLKEGWAEYQNNDFTIHYPQGWEATENLELGIVLIVKSKPENDTDEFMENVNVIMQDVSAYNLTLEEYTKISEEQISSYITNAKLLESKTLKNENGDYRKIIYTGKQGKFNLQFEQYYWVLKGEAWVLTLTTEENAYTRFKEDGEEMLNSFRLK